MKSCEQTPGMNLLQHGKNVFNSYEKLIYQLSNGTNDIEILDQLWAKFKHTHPNSNVLFKYMLFHDCGKYLCLTIDEEGKRHFPNHAEISSKQYAAIFPEDGFTKQLIAMDMDFHTNKGDDLLRTCRSPFAPILYFTAWAEINANAIAFGGIDSESYKIKRSRLIQAGKKLLNN